MNDSHSSLLYLKRCFQNVWKPKAEFPTLVGAGESLAKIPVKPCIYISLIFCLFSCMEAPHISRIDGSKIQEEVLTQRIQHLVDTAQVAGLAVCIFNQKEPIYQKSFGYANLETQDSLQTQDLFYGASLSKAVFGYLIAQLTAEGVLDLDKPLQDYLDTDIPDLVFEKEWKGYADLKEDKRYEQITARMCLNHSTGFPNWRWITPMGEFDPEGDIRFLFDPGTRYSYSGEGMNLLQYVVEDITGKGLEELAQERIFKPLGMNMTSYVWQERFENSYCYGHTQEGTLIPKDPFDEAGAAGSMETTMEDYTKFLGRVLGDYAQKSQLTDLLFEPSIRIHSKAQFGPKAWENTSAYDTIELGYGMGWGLFQSPHGFAAFKEGHGEGFQHYTILFPEKEIGLILMSNSDNAESIFKELLELCIADTYTPWKWELYIPYDWAREN